MPSDIGALNEAIAHHTISPKIQAIKVPYGLGAVAIQKLEKGTPFLSIPLSDVLSVDSNDYKLVNGWCKKHNLNFIETTTLVLTLLKLMKSPSSLSIVWSIWISNLPQDLDFFPLFWSEEKLYLIEGTRLHTELTILKQKLQSYWTSIEPHIDQLTEQETTFADFLAAFSLFWSRCFLVKVDDRTMPVMVPFADLMNHDKSSDVYIEYSDGYLKYCSDSEIPEGQEVFFNYGNKPIAAFLLSYGFVPCDSIDTLIFTPPMEDSYAEIARDDCIDDQSKVQYLMHQIMSQRLGYRDRMGFVLADDINTLSVMRILLATPEEIYEIFQHEDLFEQLKQPLSISTELAISKYLSEFAVQTKHHLDVLLANQDLVGDLRTYVQSQHKLALDALSWLSSRYHYFYSLSKPSDTIFKSSGEIQSIKSVDGISTLTSNIDAWTPILSLDNTQFIIHGSEIAVAENFEDYVVDRCSSIELAFEFDSPLKQDPESLEQDLPEEALTTLSEYIFACRPDATEGALYYGYCNSLLFLQKIPMKSSFITINIPSVDLRVRCSQLPIIFKDNTIQILSPFDLSKGDTLNALSPRYQHYFVNPQVRLYCGLECNADSKPILISIDENDSVHYNTPLSPIQTRFNEMRETLQLKKMPNVSKVSSLKSFISSL